MSDCRIAVACHDPATVVARLCEKLNLEFEFRESSYWGPYWSNLSGGIRVFINEDPMYNSETDGQEEFFFETRFPDHRTLIDVEGDTELGIRIFTFLLQAYPGSHIIAEEGG